MASKTPLQKLQDTIVGTVKGAVTHPVDTAGKAVEQAKGTISVGRVVAGQVVKGAADVVTSRLPGRHGGGATTTHAPDRTPEASRPAPASTATTERAAPIASPATTLVTPHLGVFTVNVLINDTPPGFGAVPAKGTASSN